MERPASALEEMASTAEELSGQAEQLASMISFFTLEMASAAPKRQKRAEQIRIAHLGKGQETRRAPAELAELAAADKFDEEFERY